MASSRAADPANNDNTSYRAMQVGELDVGAHCQAAFCRQLDFLPFKCESCKGNYCLDHRTESAHHCPRAGEWARQRAQTQLPSSAAFASQPKRTILTHEQQCSEPSCKTLINTPLVTGVTCDTCRRSYCLKHRFGYEHDCDKLAPLGARASGQQTQREKGLAALEKFKAWGAAKKAAMPKASLPQSKAKQSAAAYAQSIATLKRTGKGDEKIPADKRIYLHVEAASDSVTSKISKGAFFYSTDYSVGRVLDLAAKSLQVSNVNNRSDHEEDKLRIFHVDAGRLLEFGEKLGQTVKTGDTIVLLRGVGPGMAATPEKTT